MTKNEYRRSLILLRSNESGYSGHVRMERRVTMGSMVFALQTPQTQDALRAALIGRDKRGYYACAIGDIRRDARGQGTLTFSFDPRNICGRELDMYRLIAVVRTGANGCALALLGNLNGYADMDLQPALDAVCRLYGVDNAEPPAPEIGVMPPKPESGAAPSIPEEIDPDFSVSEEIDPGEIDPEFSVSQEKDSETSASEIIGLDTNAPWPAMIENARQYFQDQSPAEDVPDDEYVYVRVPVEGLDVHLLTGVRVENGKIASVAYALPADYAADPPEGLSDYSWQGDGQTGWWTLKIDLESDV